MNDKPLQKGKNIYVQSHLIPLLERYAEDNNLDVAKAVNEIITDRFRKATSDDQAPATKRDIKRLLKRIELGNLMFEPALLELLEASAAGKLANSTDADAGQLGAALKKRFTEMFGQLRDMVDR